MCAITQTLIMKKKLTDYHKILYIRSLHVCSCLGELAISKAKT